MCDYFAREKVDNYANIKIVLSQFKTSNIADPSLIRLLSIELLPQNVLLSFWLTQFQLWIREKDLVLILPRVERKNVLQKLKMMVKYTRSMKLES